MTQPKEATIEREKVPEWVDMARLCFECCTCPSTVDVWVRERLLPPPRRVRGKLMWRWRDVDAWLASGGPPGEDSDSLEARITASTKQAFERRQA